MSPLTIAIVVVFVLGYLCIALENVTKVNKAAVALFMFVAVWTLYMLNPAAYVPGLHGNELINRVTEIIQVHLGDTSTTLFFLMGAMTIVEIVDQNGGFNFVRNALRTKSKKSLLWRIAFLTFFLSAILDNMTTTIVMIMVLRKLVAEHRDRIIYASLVVIAANAGGAFSPIGDVTTIMLWNKALISSAGVIKELILPSIISMVIPALLLCGQLKGELQIASDTGSTGDGDDLNAMQRKVVFVLGVGGLIFVPIFRYITDLPPFVGILLVLSVLWITTEIFYSAHKNPEGSASFNKRVSNLLRKIDISTILFFLGILMAVSCLQEVKVLSLLGQWLNDVSSGNHYVVTGAIGLMSSIVDNVPLVAGCMGMYPLTAAGDFACDGVFWQLLGYCAGVGGSILIIGSAAGVVAMGLEKISFGWYMKHISWLAVLGYFAGMVSYWLLRTFILV